MCQFQSEATSILIFLFPKTSIESQEIPEIALLQIMTKFQEYSLLAFNLNKLRKKIPPRAVFFYFPKFFFQKKVFESACV